MKLTAKSVEALRHSGRRRLEIWDQALPGFGIRISPTGGKSWFCIARAAGRQRRFTLGTYPRLSLGDARDAARKIMTDARFFRPDIQGSLPTVTLGETIPLFIELYAKPKNRCWHGSEKLLRRHFSSLFDLPITKITRQAIVCILDDLVARGTPGSANHAMAAIKKLLNWALNRGLIEINPIIGLSAPGKIKSRERILREGEICSLLNATDAQGYPFGTIYWLLLYTGQRRGEVSGMRWSEVDLGRAVWTIPAARSKNGLAHEVPLATTVIEMLMGIPRFQGSDFVFTTTGRSAVSGFGRAKYRFEAAVGAKDWWVHDLRARRHPAWRASGYLRM